MVDRTFDRTFQEGRPRGSLSLEGGLSLSEKAYRLIKREIIRCELGPGSQVTEVQLAERYQVGRAAVRSALNRLHQDRLVQVVSRQSYIIAPITIKDVRDLFGVRQLLEPPAARIAGGKIDNSLVHHLDQLCQASYRLGDRESAEAFLAANTEFHVTIARASQNARLVAIMAALLAELERLFHLGLMLRDRNDEMYHEHHDLVEALVAGDGERAERITSDQLRAAERMVVDALVCSPTLAAVNLGGR